MRIANNLMALNARRQLGINQTDASQVMEKLSSGFRINCAADDAAGLAISEKMRGQIRGLKQAGRNGQDGISLIQTAEGALNETHAILQRMRELAVQAATDTNTEIDREHLQEEVNQLASELDRIAESTEFNTQALLDGSFTNNLFHIGSNQGQNIKITIGDLSTEGLDFTEELAIYKEKNIRIGGQDGVYVRSITGDELTIRVSISRMPLHDEVQDRSKLTTVLNTENKEITVYCALGENDYSNSTQQDVVDALFGIAEEAGISLRVDSDVFNGAPRQTTGYTFSVLAGEENIEEVLGNVFAISVTTRIKADKAIAQIDQAIDYVSEERSKLGAMQNRLEHTIANLSTSAENLQAAESRIRDLDMADEIMAFTKNNILQQAVTAMLAQANMAPQSVLQLLG